MSFDPSQLRLAEIHNLSDYCNLWNRVWPDHVRGVGELQREYEHLPTNQKPNIWLLAADGHDIAFLNCEHDIGSYHPQKWTASLGVLPKFRGQGIGAGLFDFAEAWLIPQSPISVASRVSDQDELARNFCLSRGFAEVKRDFESILYLSKVKPENLIPTEVGGVEFRSAGELDSPVFRKELHEVFEVVRIDTPRSEPPTPMPFEQFNGLVLEDPEFLWGGSQMALVDGRVIGFSGLFRMEGVEGQIFQWLTAVKREHRGKGVAKALKIRGAKWAIRNGFTAIRTDNDTRNGPMLAINDRLGFERLPGMITMQKRFDAVPP